MTPRARSAGAHDAIRATPLALLAGVVFLVLVTGNSAGYRYGVSDQAFYLPAIEARLDPLAFPRDGSLIEGQARLLLLDDVLAQVVDRTGLSLPAGFAIAFALTGLVMGAACVALGRAFALGPWSLAAFVLAMTLRHHVLGTGVNTFEGYFHPRVLAFGVGLLAVSAMATDRFRLALLLVGLALATHPTTALWFAGWLAVAGAIASTQRGGGIRPGAMMGTIAAGALVLIILAWTSGMGAQLTLRMDDTWLAPLASRGYLFPNRWPPSTWLAHGAIVATIVTLAAWRARLGIAVKHETAIVIGALGVVAGFLVSLPLIASRVAFAVQLQTSRVLWVVDALATLFVVWALIEAPGRGPQHAHDRPATTPWRGMLVTAVLAAASLGRAVYGGIVEHPERPFARVQLPADAWTETLDWVRRSTPAEAHVLADPGHAWKFGASVRIGAVRDVYLEEVKDAAMSLYARGTAERVLTRIDAVGDFSTLTPERLEALRERFRLDYVICENEQARQLGLPVAWRNQRFSVIALAPRPRKS